MPKFAPNTGFKMPGVGSKNIDSPGNFRDEQHVDKVGYCDTTEDSMLPEGSSPLKARYTSSGYLKDLDAIRIPSSKKSKCPEGSKLVDGKCVPINDGKVKQNKTSTSKSKTQKLDIEAKMPDVKVKALPAEELKTGKETRVVKVVPENVKTKAGDKIYRNKTQEQKDAQDAAFEKIQKKNTKEVKQERNYNIVNGKKVYIGGFKDKI